MPRGGKRRGAGRRKVKPSGTGMKKATAEQILNSIPEHEYWRDLIEAETDIVVGKEPNKKVVTIIDKRLRMEALKYLTDKRDGKAPQAIHHAGPGGSELRVKVEHIGSSYGPDPPAA